MKKRILACILALVLAISLVPAAFAATDEATEAAQALYEMGLFRGVGKDANGNPNFDLDRTPSRNEAVTMLVRLLGKEQEAKDGTWVTPFTDVTGWAKPYVGYAYERGLTAGASSTTYGGDADVTVSQYLTFVLRALGYTSGTDFKWNAAWELSDKIGLTDGRYNASTTHFTRGDVAIISANTLNTSLKGQSKTLLSSLVESGAVDSDKAEHYSSNTTHSPFLTWQDVFDNRVYAYYVKMDADYYNFSNLCYELSFVNNEVYIPVKVLKDMMDDVYLHQDSYLLSLLCGAYTIKPSNNPYLSGSLDLYFKNQLNAQVDIVYVSATDYYTKWQVTVQGKTISSPDEPIKNEFTVDGIRYVGIPVSGKSEVSYWVNANDLCKACGIDKQFSYIEKDTSTGFNQVLVFE